jgi:hypothetical protein
MKRLPCRALAALLLLSLLLGDARAGPYDGEWNGYARGTSGRCQPADVTLVVGGMTVGGTAVAGQARFERDTPIRGTVTLDGALSATIGFVHLTGIFSGDMFSGTFRRFDCRYEMELKKQAG